MCVCVCVCVCVLIYIYIYIYIYNLVDSSVKIKRSVDFAFEYSSISVQKQHCAVFSWSLKLCNNFRLERFNFSHFSNSLVCGICDYKLTLLVNFCGLCR